MKLKDHLGEMVNVTWGDHAPSCVRCREVDTEKPATFAQSCPQGGRLLMELMTRRQAPVVKEMRNKVLAEAKKAGVFVTHRDKKVQTKYFGE